MFYIPIAYDSENDKITSRVGTSTFSAKEVIDQASTMAKALSKENTDILIMMPVCRVYMKPPLQHFDRPSGTLVYKRLKGFSLWQLFKFYLRIKLEERAEKNALQKSEQEASTWSKEYLESLSKKK